jgi:sulfate permease, SulP family
MNKAVPATFREQFSISNLLPSFMTGLIIVLVDVSLYISMGALLFNGILASYLPNGVGLFFFGAVIFSMLVALLSSYSGTISAPQDVTAVILGIIVAGISAQMASTASLDTIFITAAAAIALTTLLTGGLFLLLGYFKLGNLIRFIPFPVIGGFLAGTGGLLVMGSLSVMTGAPLTLAGLGSFFSSPALVQWLPGSVLAVLMLVTLRRFQYFLIIPGFVVAASLLFYLLIRIAGLSLPQAVQAGFLFEPFPAGTLYTPLPPVSYIQIDWAAVLSQSSNIAIACLIATISLLLNASSIELAVDREIDLNQELRAAGFSNLLAGVGGSPVGFSSLSFSILNQKLGGGSRATGFFVALLFVGVILFGAPLVELFPVPVLGALLLFLGLSFVVEWLYDGWRRLSKADYAMVLIIMITMNIWGPLAGVGLGITLAAGLFVLKYSQVKVIKHTLSGEIYHSAVDRQPAHRAYLRQHGRAIQIFELQGYLFFGTAQFLLEQVRTHACLPQRPSKYILLDFRQVSGCDSSAVTSFQRIAQLAGKFDFILAFTHLPAALRDQLEVNGITAFEPGTSGDEQVALDGPSEGGPSQGRPSEGGPSEGQSSEDQPSQGQSSEDQPSQGQSSEDQPSQGGSSEDRVVFFPALDAGVEWCENRILAAGGIDILEPCMPLLSALGRFTPPGSDSTRLLAYLEKLEVERGYLMMRQGEASDALYYLESGSAAIYLELPGDKVTRIRTLRSGSLVGEVGYYTASPRTASVRTSEACVLYRLAYADFDRLQAAEPELGAALHHWLAALMAERVTDNTRIITALAK